MSRPLFGSGQTGHNSIESVLLAREAAKAAEQQASRANSTALQADKEALKARGKVDFNFFAGIVAPGVLKKLFPAFYLNLFSLLTIVDPDPEAILRFALGLPRGFAKTTFLKILTCWFILYGYHRFILVVAATEPKALDFINDVDEMLASPQTEEVYGAWSSTKLVNNAKRKIALFNGQKIILVPMGEGTTVRGINIGNERPSLIICDDIQTREGALSETTNLATIEWFTSSLLKCLPPEGSHRTVIFLGNMYPGECLLKKLKDNGSWKSLITGAILSDGESLWPELKSVRALFAEYVHDEGMGMGHIWFAEVQNDPLDGLNKLLNGVIPGVFDQLVEQTPPDAMFIICDPAGFRKRSDHNVISVYGLYDGVPICLIMKGGRWDPRETVIQLLSTAIETRSSVIAIESTAYQQSLLFWVNHFMEKANIQGIHVVEVTTNNRTKFSRIDDFIKELYARTAGMAKQARAIFTYYAGMYKIGKSDNRDDYLDCPAYAKQVITKYLPLLTTREAVKASLDDLPKVITNDII